LVKSCRATLSNSTYTCPRSCGDRHECHLHALIEINNNGINVNQKTAMPQQIIDDPVGVDTQPELSEADKLQLVRSRFEHINELDLQDGQSFFAELDGGI
jgi:hypothetical protein